MAERIQHPTTTDVREHLDRIEELTRGIRAYLCMFDARPETGIADRIVAAFREIQVDAGGGARCQQAVTAWATELSAAVGADVAALPEAGDLLAAPPPFDGLMGIFGATSEIAGPQEDREDDTADRHDETTQDWNRLVRGSLVDRDDIRKAHPFPIDLSDEEDQW